MMEIIKNKEEVKSVMNIIQAFADGKTIQAIDPYEDEWVDQAELNFEALFDGQYRIKPEPKYRPFANAEECWNEMKKHHPFGWIKPTADSIPGKFMIINSIRINEVSITSGIDFTYNELLKYYTFVDETPFGVKVEE